MYHVYILQSIDQPERFYTGFTRNIKNRLQAHNMGQDKYTSKFKPWKIKTSISFSDKEQALNFERYLKTPSRQVLLNKNELKIT